MLLNNYLRAWKNIIIPMPDVSPTPTAITSRWNFPCRAAAAATAPDGNANLHETDSNTPCSTPLIPKSGNYD
jgi:hypothetical protein